MQRNTGAGFVCLRWSSLAQGAEGGEKIWRDAKDKWKINLMRFHRWLLTSKTIQWIQYDNVFVNVVCNVSIALFQATYVHQCPSMSINIRQGEVAVTICLRNCLICLQLSSNTWRGHWGNVCSEPMTLPQCDRSSWRSARPRVKAPTSSTPTLSLGQYGQHHTTSFAEFGHGCNHCVISARGAVF